MPYLYYIYAIIDNTALWHTYSALPVLRCTHSATVHSQRYGALTALILVLVLCYNTVSNTCTCTVSSCFIMLSVHLQLSGDVFEVFMNELCYNDPLSLVNDLIKQLM